MIVECNTNERVPTGTVVEVVSESEQYCKSKEKLRVLSGTTILEALADSDIGFSITCRDVPDQAEPVATSKKGYLLDLMDANNEVIEYGAWDNLKEGIWWLATEACMHFPETDFADTIREMVGGVPE